MRQNKKTENTKKEKIHKYKKTKEFIVHIWQSPQNLFSSKQKDRKYKRTEHTKRQKKKQKSILRQKKTYPSGSVSFSQQLYILNSERCFLLIAKQKQKLGKEPFNGFYGGWV